MLRLRLPRWCAVCEMARADPICDACELDFFDRRVARCPQCALPVPSAGLRCGRCLAAPPAFERAVALADYAPPIDGMVGALKFSARLDLATVFGRLLAQRIEAMADSCAVALPLAPQRLAERGYNQSLLIARAFAQAAGIALAPSRALRRIRHGAPQQSLPLDARRRNVRGAFIADPWVAGRKIWLIDDVMTTGSTLDEAARALTAAGCSAVHAGVVARTR